MDNTHIDDILERTLDDLRLSRSERTALDEILAGLDRDSRRLEVVRSRAFEVARARLSDSKDVAVLDWLEAVIRAIESAGTDDRSTRVAEAWFSPHSDCAGRIVQLIQRSRDTIDVCVFTITSDRITSALLAAHERGITVRVITDDLKAGDLGSDIADLERAGIALATDDSSSHMHNKFAIFDGHVVITGSYNWTRSAARANQENLIVTDNPAPVRRFIDEFDRLWRTFRR